MMQAINSHQQASPDTLTFNCLPPEIRVHVWKFTLPKHPRLFHVESLSLPQNNETSFEFHVRHKPPVALEVCYESRETALDQGFFFTEGNHPGVWFSPRSDILYFDQMFEQRWELLLRTQENLNIRNWNKVRNVGIHWQIPFSWERPFGERNTITTRFYSHMPALKTVNIIFPMLDLRFTTIDWIYARSRNPILLPFPEGDGSFIRPPGKNACLLVKSPQRMRPRAMTYAELKRDVAEGMVGNPSIVGWWLERENQDEQTRAPSTPPPSPVPLVEGDVIGMGREAIERIAMEF